MSLLPGVQADGLDLADLGNVAMDPGAAQADEYAEGVRGPVRVWKAKGTVSGGPGPRLEAPVPQDRRLAWESEFTESGTLGRDPCMPPPKRSSPTGYPSCLGTEGSQTASGHRSQGRCWTTASRMVNMPDDSRNECRCCPM